MKNEDILKLINQAKKYARRKGLPLCQAEEFAQEALLKYHIGRDTGFKRLFIDYLRETSGRKGTPGYTPASRFKSMNNLQLVNLKAKDPKLNEFLSLVNAHIDDQKLRTIGYLKGKWGFTDLEIAECFGISEGRVGQYLKKIVKLLREKINS